MHSHSTNCCHVGVLRVLEEAKHNDIPAKKGIFTSWCFTHHRFISLQKEKKSQTVNAMTFSLNTKNFDLTHPHNHRPIFLHIFFPRTQPRLTNSHTNTLTRSCQWRNWRVNLSVSFSAAMRWELRRNPPARRTIQTPFKEDNNSSLLLLQLIEYHVELSYCLNLISIHFPAKRREEERWNEREDTWLNWSLWQEENSSSGPRAWENAVASELLKWEYF